MFIHCARVIWRVLACGHVRDLAHHAASRILIGRKSILSSREEYAGRRTRDFVRIDNLDRDEHGIGVAPDYDRCGSRIR